MRARGRDSDGRGGSSCGDLLINGRHDISASAALVDPPRRRSGKGDGVVVGGYGDNVGCVRAKHEAGGKSVACRRYGQGDGLRAFAKIVRDDGNSKIQAPRLRDGKAGGSGEVRSLGGCRRVIDNERNGAGERAACQGANDANIMRRVARPLGRA